MKRRFNFSAKYDQTKPPTEWFTPYYGNGLETTRDALDTDSNSYGYCFQPQVESGSGPIRTMTSLSVHGFNEELQGEFEQHIKNGFHPYFATRDEAVTWLKERGLFGQVMRYAHHKPLEERGPTWDYDNFSQRYEWKQYHPCLTAGVTDIVTDKMDVACTTPLGMLEGFVLHQPDGTIRVVSEDSGAFEGAFIEHDNEI